MSAALENPQEIASTFDLEQAFEQKRIETLDREASYSVYSTLKELPGYSVVLDSSTTGEELGKLLTALPDLPGIILLEEGRLVGAISQSHYYKCVSRAFGREVYQRRSATLMLEGLNEPPLVLLSGCGIQQAVEQCLSRPTELVYEPFVVRGEETSEYWICSFQSLLLASSKIAAMRNDQMAQILNSITDGLLVIDRTYRIGNEYSRAAAHIFERTDLDRFSLLEILEPLIDPTLYTQIADYLKVLFNPKLIDKLIRTINPAKQISVRFLLPEEHIKHFTFNFERVRSQGEISHVLVRVEDITRQLNLAKELEKQEAAAEEKLQLILQLLRVDPKILKEFIRKFREGLIAVDQMLQTAQSDRIHEVFRIVHTLKGESALLQLSLYERPLHRLEDGLVVLRENEEFDASRLSSVASAMEALRTLDENTGNALAHLNQLSSPNSPSSAEFSAPEHTGPLALAARMVKNLSNRLGKPVAFHSTVRNGDLPAAYREIINDLLLHLVRNSMVHGIESTIVREACGKSATGTIQFAIKPHSDFHEIIFQDDGAGLNYEKIQRRAAQLGRTLSTPDEFHDAIFLPGFSTAENVSDLAGRGVGLDAIRHSVAQSGGSIHVYSEEGSYCAFQVLLPRVASPEKGAA